MGRRKQPETAEQRETRQKALLQELRRDINEEIGEKLEYVPRGPLPDQLRPEHRRGIRDACDECVTDCLETYRKEATGVIARAFEGLIRVYIKLKEEGKEQEFFKWKVDGHPGHLRVAWDNADVKLNGILEAHTVVLGQRIEKEFKQIADMKKETDVQLQRKTIEYCSIFLKRVAYEVGLIAYFYTGALGMNAKRLKRYAEEM